jgi:hypothetical protein
MPDVPEKSWTQGSLEPEFVAMVIDNTPNEGRREIGPPRVRNESCQKMTIMGRDLLKPTMLRLT